MQRDPREREKEEAVLIHRIWRALREEDPATALELLAAYRQRFPEAFYTERGFLLVFAMCEDWYYDAAARQLGVQLADEYLERFPHGHRRDFVKRMRQRFVESR